MNDEILQTLKALEYKQFDPQIRNSPEELDRFLAEDFYEFTPSGKKLNKQEVLKLLPKQQHPKFEASDFKFKSLGSDVVFLTFKTKETNQQTGALQQNFRSSIWIKEKNEWKLYFHQATPSAS